MSGRRIGVLLVCLVVALLAAWYAGSRFPSPAPSASTGSVRLGPEPGEAVAGYLARLPADLPPPGVHAPALVQFAAERTAEAAALVAADGATLLLTAVLRVPLPRVQTALRYESLEPGTAPATALRNARERAQLAAAGDRGRLTGRPGAVAAAEAAALADPTCECVLALVVRADRAALQMLAARPGVRAVHAAPPGSAARELALSPLLPGQTERADPLPDDGPPPT